MTMTTSGGTPIDAGPVYALGVSGKSMPIDENIENTVPSKGAAILPPVKYGPLGKFGPETVTAPIVAASTFQPESPKMSFICSNKMFACGALPTRIRRTGAPAYRPSFCLRTRRCPSERETRGEVGMCAGLLGLFFWTDGLVGGSSPRGLFFDGSLFARGGEIIGGGAFR